MNRKFKIVLIVIGAIWLFTEILPFGFSWYDFDYEFTTNSKYHVNTRKVEYSEPKIGRREMDEVEDIVLTRHGSYNYRVPGGNVNIGFRRPKISYSRYFPFYKPVSFSNEVNYQIKLNLRFNTMEANMTVDGEISMEGDFSGYGLISGREVANILEKAMQERIGEVMNEALQNEVRGLTD